MFRDEFIDFLTNQSAASRSLDEVTPEKTR